MAVEMESPLRAIRAELGVSREKLARRTDLSIGTVRNAESGARITYGNAQQILAATNALLLEAGKPEVSLADLGLVLY